MLLSLLPKDSEDDIRLLDTGDRKLYESVGGASKK